MADAPLKNAAGVAFMCGELLKRKKFEHHVPTDTCSHIFIEKHGNDIWLSDNGTDILKMHYGGSWQLLLAGTVLCNDIQRYENRLHAIRDLTEIPLFLEVVSGSQYDYGKIVFHYNDRFCDVGGFHPIFFNGVLDINATVDWLTENNNASVADAFISTLMPQQLNWQKYDDNQDDLTLLDNDGVSFGKVSDSLHRVLRTREILHDYEPESWYRDSNLGELNKRLDAQSRELMRLLHDASEYDNVRQKVKQQSRERRFRIKQLAEWGM